MAVIFLAAVGIDASAATLTVTTLADDTVVDGECSLREALENASNNNQASADCPAGTGDDEVTFDAGLFSGDPSTATISLGALLAASGGGLTIAPPSGHRLILEGSGTQRVLSLSSSADPFELRDVDIRGGRANDGAGIRLQNAESRFVRVRFIDNVSTGSGGALYRNWAVDGSLEFEDCLFEDNAGSRGGAVYSNSSGQFDIDISGSDFINNSSQFGGGAVFVDVEALSSPGTPALDIASSRFQGNQSARRGGALHIRTDSSSDGRIEATITDSVFSTNHSDRWGGAIYASASPTGVQQELAIRRSSLIENSSDQRGGALAVNVMDLKLENSLLLDNEATNEGGAAYITQGGSLPRDVVMVGNSFYRNGYTGESSSDPRTLALSGPVDATGWSWHIAGNLFGPRSDPHPAGGPECAIFDDSPVITGGANLSGESSCLLLPGDTEADPMVALAATGDPLTPSTLLPQPGSPLIDLWPEADCQDTEGAALTVDLRGEPRPGNGDGIGAADCDTGAFELNDAHLVTVSLAGSGGGAVTSDPAGIDCGTTCSVGFAEGTTVTLTATAVADSVFSGWSGDCSGTGDCVLTLDGDKNVTATFDELPSFVLDVTLSGNGSGAVGSSPSGIDCEPSCSASFAEGTEVTLTATPDANSTFEGWSGAGCSGSGDCVVTLNADTTINAAFAATQLPVEVALAGSGSGSVTSDPAGIDCPGDCAEAFGIEETVTLTANPAGGSAFTGWSGDCSGPGDCVLDMDTGPYSVSAGFEILRTLTVQPQGGGSGTVTSDPAGIDCPGDCDAQYADGAEVTLTPVADPGSVFAGWTGACSGSGACTVTMDENRTVNAVFQTGSFELTVTVNGSGAVTSDPAGIDCPGDCAQTYLAGSVIELTAAPDEGHSFTGWSGACSGTGPCVVTMNEARSITADFEEGPADTVFADRFEAAP
jgi:CSLREA domain-containing protein